MSPDNIAIHTTTVGTPPEGQDRTGTIVFLHGLFGQGKNFTTIAKALQPDFASLLVDLPNHGRSGWTDSIDYDQMADAVAHELRGGVAADGPVHLVGHSMGGKVAMMLALRHPELVERLVVVDIAPGPGGGTEEFEHLLGALATLDLEALESRSHADAQLTELIASPTVRGFLLQNLQRADGGGWRWRANLDLLRAQLDVVGGFPDVDATYDGPVLWVAGDRSDYVRPEHGERMRELFPRTRQLTVKDSGHWVHSEQPKVFTQALRVFLATDA